MEFRTPLFALCALMPATAHAASLDQSTLTEVVKEVSILDPASKTRKPAKPNDLFKTPQVLRTGPDSRAEMLAEDQTVTRVGANTLFSFEPSKREINLQQGSVLFNSPTGKGGGTIKTAAATAAVLGTTLIAVTTRNGGFKVLLIEGQAKVTTPNGENRTLKAGQMTFVLPGQKLGPVYQFQLKEQVTASRLVGGFKKDLPSLPKIQQAIQQQQAEVQKGKLVPTGLLAGDTPSVAYRTDVGARETAIREEQAQRDGRKPPQPPPPTLADDPDEARFQLARNSDAILSGGGLPADRLFARDNPAILSRRPIDPADPKDTANSRVLVSRNLTIASPSVLFGEPGLNSQFVLAFGDLYFAQSTLLDSPETRLNLTAGGTMRNLEGVRVETNSPNFELVAHGDTLALGKTGNNDPATFSDLKPLTLKSFVIENTAGNVFLHAPSLQLDNAGLIARGTLAVRSEGSVNLKQNVSGLETWQEFRENENNPQADPQFPRTGTALQAGNDLRVVAKVNLDADTSDFVAERTSLHAGGKMKLQNARFSNRDVDGLRGRVELSAGQELRVDQTRIRAREVVMRAVSIDVNQLDVTHGFYSSTEPLSPQSPRTELIAENLLRVNGAQFQSQRVIMRADTIDLSEVHFIEGSRVELLSRLGTKGADYTTAINGPNPASQPGKVNFLSNVTYGGQPAPTRIVTSPSPEARGIVIRPR
jgi:hypothetical protein